MSKDYIVLIELLLIVGLVLWFGFSQLRSLQKLKRPPPERDKNGSERDR